jgi:hypothetical protein
LLYLYGNKDLLHEYYTDRYLYQKLLDRGKIGERFATRMGKNIVKIGNALFLPGLG